MVSFSTVCSASGRRGSSLIVDTADAGATMNKGVGIGVLQKKIKKIPVVLPIGYAQTFLNLMLGIVDGGCYFKTHGEET